MAKGNSGTQMEMSTKVFGKTTKLMGTESMSMSMAPSMKATGETICKMDKVLNLGATVVDMKVVTKRV